MRKGFVYILAAVLLIFGAIFYISSKPTKKEISVFLAAVKQGKKADVVRLVKEKSRLINVSDKDKMTSLHWALAKNHNDIARILVRNGANVNARNKSDHTPLFFVDDQAVDLVNLLIKKGAKVGCRSNTGWTVLHSVTNPILAQIYIDNGADVNAQLSQQKVDHYYHYPYTGAFIQGSTPLHIAVDSEDEDIIKILIKNGAGPEIKDSKGRTPLFLSLNSYVCTDERISALLIDAGASLDGTSILLEALYNNKFATAKKIIDQGIDLNTKDNDGKTILHHAVELYTSYQDIIPYLVQHWAKINVRDNKGKTPLFYAIGSPYSDQKIRLLIRLGADVNIRDKNGWTLLHELSSDSEPTQSKYLTIYLDTADILIDSGIDISAKTTQDCIISPNIHPLNIPAGITALDIASLKKNKQLTEFFRKKSKK